MTRAGLLLLYGFLCCIEFCVAWGKERLTKALKDPAPEVRS